MAASSPSVQCFGCGETPHPGAISLSKPAESSEFRSWLARQPNPYGLESIKDAKDWEDIWHADIDNDGELEWVVADYDGLGNLGLTLFKKDGSGFKNIGDLPWPEGIEQRDGGWYYGKAEDFLIKIHGKTYIAMSGGRSESIEGYLWMNGKNRRACDTDFTGYVFSKFKGAFDANKYLSARNILEWQLKTCKEEMTSEGRLLLESNVAFAASRLNDGPACSDWVNVAKLEPGFSQSRFKKSVLHNDTLCVTQGTVADHGPGSLERGGLTDDELLVQTVPDISFLDIPLDKHGLKWKANGMISDKDEFGNRPNYNLREDLSANLSLPNYDSLPTGQHAFTVSGCRPHDCEDKGFLWMDSAQKASVFALNHAWFTENTYCYTLGSRTLAFSKLPRSLAGLS